MSAQPQIYVALPAALQALIAAGESQTLEFKTSFDKASIETLVAFANAQGGTLGKETLNEWLWHIQSGHLLRRHQRG